MRDDKVWSQLVPCADQERELYTVFRFHFPNGLDNSGFVGWLASHLKARLGTGVFVICGQNSARRHFRLLGLPRRRRQRRSRRDRGVATAGRRDLVFAERRAREAGLAALDLYTNEAMRENLALYSRLGFVEVGRRDDAGYRRVFLRKTLA